MKYDGDGRATARFFSDKGSRRWLRFTRPCGAWHHVTATVRQADEVPEASLIFRHHFLIEFPPECNAIYAALD